MRYFILLILMLGFQNSSSQGSIIEGVVRSSREFRALSEVLIKIEGTSLEEMTDEEGRFVLTLSVKGTIVLLIHHEEYQQKRIPIVLEGSLIDLGDILLDRDIEKERNANLIWLSEDNLLDDGLDNSLTPMLQATRDVFLNRAAFDFGQAFFRIRGYDSRNSAVLINGIPMNKMYNGRPQWNNWGGLNDVTRNQQYSHGPDANEYSFGGILGTTNIDIRPSKQPPGLRLSSSVSNRTYLGRLMATYNSGQSGKGFTYAIAASRRWAQEGQIDGTLYDAYSVFGALDYKLNKRNNLSLTAFLASNRRGSSAPITEEIYRLAGRTYNPYWGMQNGELRNSRERRIHQPIFIFNHFFESKHFKLNTGIAIQSGNTRKSRLSYFDAPNPDPTYYRYLPSFHVNSPIGANFVNAELSKTAFLEEPQISWQSLYLANSNQASLGRAAYLLQDDIVADTQITANGNANLKISNRLNIDFGATFRQLHSKNFARIKDLLGAEFHLDIDPFSNTSNDINGPGEKNEGSIFGYNYELSARRFQTFVQLRYKRKKWGAHLSGMYSKSNFEREGKFKNGRFPDNSEGNTAPIVFSNIGGKTAVSYQITGRHFITANALIQFRAPLLQKVFINPREQNEVVPDIESEKLTTIDVSYRARLSKLSARISGFYSRFQRTTDINFFFVDTGVGSDFVQEVISSLDKLHLGLEIGVSYNLSSEVKLSGVLALGKYTFASDPEVSINFDTAGEPDDLIALDGNQDLGVARLKGLRLSQGPQKALSVGLEYRSPHYWWIAATSNFLSDNYIDISAIRRTQSFKLDPETGREFREITSEKLSGLLRQKKLDDFYLFNIIGGKSWLFDGKYISLFASISNVFDTVFRTGGFEQSRNGNYGQLLRDNLSGRPSFGPKHWYGFGRTYFLNLSVSF